MVFAGYCIIRSGNSQQVARPPTLLAGKGDWLPKAIKNLRILSLQAKRSNLLADMGIASPPAAARNVTVENFLPQRRKFSTATKMSLLQKGDLFTTETTEITETKDYFIFHQKYDCKNFYYMRQAAKKLSFYS
jgi:hypothetical protein